MSAFKVKQNKDNQSLRRKLKIPKTLTSDESKELAQVLQKIDWDRETDALLGQRFQSIEQAVFVLANLVCDRMQCSESERPEQLRFIKDLFMTDPIMLEHLKSILRVG